MLFRTILLALSSAAFACGTAQAQSPSDGDKVAQQLHDKLVEQGYSDVRVVPQSFLISAKDKNGNPVMMLIGPNSMTVLAGPPSNDPNTAQSPEPKDKLIQQ
jgi:hypothetical protein